MRVTEKEYDIIYGLVANDDVYTTFTLYQAGVLTKEQTLDCFVETNGLAKQQKEKRSMKNSKIE